MQKINVVKTDKTVTGMAGVNLISGIVNRSEAFKYISEPDRGARGPEKAFSNKDLLTLGLCSFACAHPDFTDVNEFKKASEFYSAVVGTNGRLPSESLFRTRLNEIGAEMKEEDYFSLWDANVRMLLAYHVKFSTLPNGFVPVDLDVSPFDNSRSHKEGVGMTYKKVDGLANMLGYLGAQGYPIGVELRPGTQHCQKGTVAFLKRLVQAAKRLTDTKLLFRLDSGNDSADNMCLLMDDPQIRFLIKRNFRKVSKLSAALHLTQMASDVSAPRDGKRVFTGETCKTFAFKDADGKELDDDTLPFMTVRAVFQVVEHTTTPYGQFLIEPEYEIDMYYTSLRPSEASAFDVIELYHNHGTMEQYHSEFKTDLDIERFPSGKFDTNGLILNLEMMAFNALRIVEMIAREMPLEFPIHYKSTMRRRIRTVIEQLILVPAVMTKHARRKTLALGNSCDPWSDVFLYVDKRVRETPKCA